VLEIVHRRRPVPAAATPGRAALHGGLPSCPGASRRDLAAFCVIQQPVNRVCHHARGPAGATPQARLHVFSTQCSGGLACLLFESVGQGLLPGS